MAEQVEIGRPEGKTSYSDFADARYEKRRTTRNSLSASEFWMVMEGYLHEWVCMGQCNVYIQAARDTDIKLAIETYRHDVCEPNLTELKKILEDGGYSLPQDYNAVTEAKSLNELGQLLNAAIGDAQILTGMIFAAQGFMTRWNIGTASSKRTDVRDAFVRNWHRANRWHLTFYDLAVEKGFVMPLPTMDAAGMMRAAVMGS